jgi:hypothetical protein
MSAIDRRIISELAATTGPGSLVSIYLPTHRAGREIRQGPIRLKNLLRQAATELEETGMTATEAQERLAPATALLDNAHFWEHQADGLALFLGPDGLREFRCARHFDELCYVHDHFHLKPLLPLLRRETSFHVLALSLGDVRLFEVTDQAVVLMTLGDVPASLPDALGHDLEKSHLQHHAGSRPGGGREGSVFHGQGGGEDDREEEVIRFLQLVDARLEERLPPDGTPLVLVGVEEILALFHKISKRPDLVPGGIRGNLESLDLTWLHQAAWDLARPVIEKDADRAAAAFVELRGTDRAAARLKDIAPALTTGRVESLLVAADRNLWGVLGEDGHVQVHRERERGDVDLLDRLAVRGLQNGANVVARRASRLPDGTAAAAVLRY